MDVYNEDIMLPYLIIARMNGLKKYDPQDPQNMVWVSEKGERYVLTPKGFSHAVLLNYKIIYDRIKKECDRLRVQNADLSAKYEQYRKINPPIQQDVLGKGSRKKIKALLNSNNYRTIEDKLEALKKYLKITNS